MTIRQAAETKISVDSLPRLVELHDRVRSGLLLSEGEHARHTPTTVARGWSGVAAALDIARFIQPVLANDWLPAFRGLRYRTLNGWLAGEGDLSGGEILDELTAWVGGSGSASMVDGVVRVDRCA